MLVSNHELRQITEQPPVTLITQKRRLMLFSHLARMVESVDARRILIAVPQSDWKRFTGRPLTSWLASVKNDLSFNDFSEDATDVALDSPLQRLLAASTEMV